ncbi:cytochrome c oxidase assembly factor CtaG [Paenibacillus barcinonensis]|uniref:Cytochrome c oxidase assembly factor CtaG n=1 Tax=Paenibacillus barcinonensis TaxID=198119 RepID=A0A2V4VDM3_PAEBA|nr:cytochrome c oxidase assembly factor CtaG [Paenibacillus barcinonensis]PYE44352.1 putative membrane protein [Paenibacillus barcinonensis]QKS58346.1 cytochrome c oxidase assembly factor CtaG [Paenibacillus barcinonensis]
MLGLQYFSFDDLWSPLVLALFLIIAAAYLVLVGPFSERVQGAVPATAGQKITFLSGLTFLYLAQAGPFNLLGHVMFSFHMVSMALSYLVAPPLMMKGLPVWVWRSIVRWLPRRRLSFLAHPIVAAVLFNGLFSLYHLPVVHDYVMLNFTVHRLYYIVLFITSMLMWWTLLNPLPEGRQASGLSKVGFIFLNMVLLTPACGLIIFASEPLYQTYSNPAAWAEAMRYCVSGDSSTLLRSFGGPAFFNFLSSAKEDQQVGGILMKFIQEGIFVSMLAYVFAQWYRKERQEEDDDLVPSGNEERNPLNPAAKS